jgi:H+/Cl- antiporter ClcA
MLKRNADFACAVVIVGLLAGLAGLATTLLLRSVEHLTYHYTFGSLLQGVTASSPIRRAVGPVIGGAIAGLGWWLQRSRVAVPPLAGTIAQGGRVTLTPFGIDAALQIVAVGSGASLGREGAPRQLAAAFGDLGIGWLRRLSRREREILLACAAGAGLAAVYSVPISGALFATRVMLRTWQPKVLGTALISSSLAVAVASVVTHERPVLDWPGPHVSVLLIGIALLLSPLTFAVGMGFNRLMNAAVVARIGRSWTLIPAIATIGVLMGLCSQWLPDLPGNGKSVLTVSLDTRITILSAAALLVLKPVMTALYLRSGATGGLLTPALATGAAVGTLATLIANSLTGMQMQVPAIALAGAAGVLAITQKAPLWAAMFVWEIAMPPIWLHLVFFTSAFASDGLRRWLEVGGGVRGKSRAAVP